MECKKPSDKVRRFLLLQDIYSFKSSIRQRDRTFPSPANHCQPASKQSSLLLRGPSDRNPEGRNSDLSSYRPRCAN
ncbi:hypothetical protein, partial [Culturomica sp.]|uniref:hypothetical protein n=1 Tax=Culturomica sp. TaxID=1926652 RepID=UPI002579E8FE